MYHGPARAHVRRKLLRPAKIAGFWGIHRSRGARLSAAPNMECVRGEAKMVKSAISTGRSYATTESKEDGQTRFFVGGNRVWGRQPREWLYATQPEFARLDEPLAKAVGARKEVRLIVDLRCFKTGHVHFESQRDRYSITATNGNMRLFKEIRLPNGAATLEREERFSKGILELVLSRKVRTDPLRQEKKGS